jgi:hypothetical protein
MRKNAEGTPYSNFESPKSGLSNALLNLDLEGDLQAVKLFLASSYMSQTKK